MPFREKKHRLPPEYYRGQISVAFTLCLKGDAQSIDDMGFIKICGEILAVVSLQHGCVVPVYCFMPDHQHFIMTGTEPASNVMKAVVAYKQRTGFWMSSNGKAMWWQKDFYDHVIKENEDIKTRARYILNNPVRKGMVKNWCDYPYSGSIGCSLDDVLLGLM